MEKTRPKINASGFFLRVLVKHETTGMMQKSKIIEHSRSNGNLIILGAGTHTYTDNIAVKWYLFW